MEEILKVGERAEGAARALGFVAGPQTVIVLGIGLKSFEANPITVVVFEACGGRLGGLVQLVRHQTVKNSKSSGSRSARPDADLVRAQPSQDRPVRDADGFFAGRGASAGGAYQEQDRCNHSPERGPNPKPRPISLTIWVFDDIETSPIFRVESVHFNDPFMLASEAFLLKRRVLPSRGEATAARFVPESAHSLLRFASHRSRRARPPSQVCSAAALPRIRPSTWGKARTSQPRVANSPATMKEIPRWPSTSTVVERTSQPGGGAHRLR